METYGKISAKLEEIKAKRRKIIEDALDGRTQQWLVDKMPINSTRLSHCINGLMEFSQDELNTINKLLGTDFTLETE